MRIFGTLLFALLLSVGTPAVGDDDAEMQKRREEILQRREWLNKLLADHLKKYPQSDLNGDGNLTSPERSIHVAKLYRANLLEEMGDTIRFVGDIEYAEVDGISLQLDLYLPPEIDPKNLPPLVTWFHGGGWRGGSKDQCLVAWLATKGFAVASIEYRSTLQAPFPANIHDCKGAIRWLRAHAKRYGYDAEQIGTSGASAGGHLASILGTSAGVAELEGTTGGNLEQSSRVQSVVDMCGVIRVAEWPGSHRGLSTILGLPHAEDNGAYELARLCSPDRHLSADDPPFLLLHGDNDKSVPLKQSQDFLAAIHKAGLQAELKILPATGHVSPNFTDAERQKLIRSFYDRHLRPIADSDSQ